MKWLLTAVVVSVAFDASALLLNEARPETQTGQDATVTITFQNNCVSTVAATLSEVFATRVCVEDYSIVDPEDKVTTPRDFASGGPIAEPNQFLFSGAYSSTTLDELLDAVIVPSPYIWQRNNACYVIYPKNGSILLKDKVTVDVPAGSLWDAVEAILAARPAEQKKEEPIDMAFAIAGWYDPKSNPERVSTGPLHLVNTTLMDALCRAVEATSPEDPIFAWSLCGGWANKVRSGTVWCVTK